MIRFRIKEMLLSKGIRYPFSWCRKLGISHSMAHRLLNGKSERISRHNMYLICKAANCTPNDLFEYHATDDTLPPEHHLHSIAPRPMSSILDKLRNMSEAEIREWERKMEDEYAGRV